MKMNNELSQILIAHSLWLRTLGAKGKRADLSCANLKGEDLRCVSFQNAYLRNADLTGANLTGADLFCANLSGAILEGAILNGANLYGTILEGAKKETQVSPQIPVSSESSNLRAKFDEFAKHLGLEIVSLKVKRTEIMDL